MTDDEFADTIEGSTIKRIKIKGDDIRLLLGPLVYLALGRNDILYVGMSSVGLSRVFAQNHSVISNIIKDITSIELYQTRTVEEAESLEKKLIKEMQPKYNKLGKFKRWGGRRA